MCGLKTQFQNDEACLLPPSPEEGFQIHVGPKDYNDMADVSRFTLPPGAENSQCWIVQLPNKTDAFYNSYVTSGRAGTHHIISNHAAPGGKESTAFTTGCIGATAVGTLPGSSKAFMPRDFVAPEFADVAYKIPANAMGTFDMHYYNFTDKPILREMWMNLFTVDPSSVKREALQMRAYGGVGWSIPPHTEQTYTYQLPVKGNGFVMNFLGHYHAHGKQFIVTITPKGTTEAKKVFEMFDYADPAIFQYNSLVKNPEFSSGAAGATSGILEVKDGDMITWSCRINNDSDAPLDFSNEVKTGEMCNLWGYSVGITKWDGNCLFNGPTCTSTSR